MDARSADSRAPDYVVGIGASAGGLEALEAFFREMPSTSGLAFVVVQHLSPDFKSLMDELLARFTTMPIVQVLEPTQLRADTIYLLPPRKELLIHGDTLVVQERAADHVLNLPINTFFRSLAQAKAERAVAIVLSGTGSDGSVGLLDVHAAGGLVLVQTQESAKFDGMPRSAIATGVVDALLSPEQMPKALLRHVQDPSRAILADGGSGELPPDLSSVFDRIQARYAVDFHAYKTSTIGRRVERRIAMTRSEGLAEYCALALRDDRELQALAEDLLIGVTRFFRDPEAFDTLARLLSRRLEGTGRDGVRVWVPGCATGEEAYSIALLLFEALAERGSQASFKVFATDLHQDSLRFAAEGVYDAERLADVPPELREKYFSPEGSQRLRVSNRLRQALVFSRHNVLRDPPFTRMDLVSCRNLLIYFQPAAQDKALAAFHFALEPRGLLFLGPSENTGTLSEHFKVLDRHWRVYEKSGERRIVGLHVPPRGVVPPSVIERTPGVRDRRLATAHEALMSRFVPPSVLIDEERKVLHYFGAVERYFRPSTGPASVDLLSMTAGDLRLALASAIQTCQRSGQRAEVRGAASETGQKVDVTVEPLSSLGSETPSFLVTLHDSSTSDAAEAAVRAEVSPEIFAAGTEARARISELEHDLGRARESLQTTVEELETSNEELQASNQELIVANEELQSTNEELHSVNEELYMVNAEHERKILELDAMTSDLQNLIRTTDIGTVFVDLENRVKLYTPSATAVFNLLPQDIQRDLGHITSRVKGDDVLEVLERIKSSGGSVETRVETPEGRRFLRRIKPYLDLHGAVAGAVLTFVDITELTRAEDALRASEEQFRHMIEVAPEGILLVDGAGVIVHANPEAARVFAASGPEGLIGCSVEDLMDPAMREKHGQWRGEFASAGTPRRMKAGRDLLARRLDGESISLEVGLSPLELGGSRLVLAHVSDVSARKAAEQEVRESAARFRQITDSLPQLVWTSRADGHCDYLSPQWLAFTGIPMEEQLGWDWLARVHPEDRSAVEQRWKHALSTGSPFTCELRLRRHDGQYRSFDGRAVPLRSESGDILRWFGAHTDVHERIESAEALRVLNAELSQSEARFRMSFEYSGLGKALLTEDGRCLRANQAFCEMLARPEAELLERDFTEFVAPSHQGELRLVPEQLFRRELPVVRTEAKLARADGREQWARITWTLVRSDDGRPLHFVVHAEDIQALKLAEAERLRMEYKLIETAKLESLGVLAGGIAHDFNNILTGILGNASLDGADLGAPAEVLTRLREIETSALRASELCRQMLAYAGRAPFAVKRVDLATFLPETAHLVRASMGKGTELRFELEPDLPAVQVDVAQIRQVIMNLLINAAEAIGDRGGSVRVRGARVLVDSDYTRLHRLSHDITPGEYVAIEVEDDGSGIDPSDVARVFDPFFTTKFTGRGLGLAATYGIVGKHSGAIELWSEKGKGTRFTILLPSAARPSNRSVEEPKESHGFPRVAGEVLVVDDEDVVRRVTLQVFEKAGIPCTGAPGGEAAVELVRAAPGRFRLVLLDFTMVGWDGARTHAELLNVDPNLAVLAMSGFSGAETLARFAEPRPASFLQKPFSPADLRRAVWAMCDARPDLIAAQ